MKTHEQMLKDMTQISSVAGHMLICTIAQGVRDSEQWDTEPAPRVDGRVTLQIDPESWKTTGVKILQYLKDQGWEF